MLNKISSLILLSLLFILFLFRPHPVTAFTTADYCMEAEEQAFLTIMNNYRISNGIGSLTATQSLGAAAEYHSIDMVTFKYFSHTLHDGTTWTQNMTNFGYTNSGGAVAENIAQGFLTAPSVFSGWQNSPGHNSNMLSFWLHATGIGKSSNTWTNDFGGFIDSPQVTRCNDGSNPDNTVPTVSIISPTTSQIISGTVPITINASDDRSLKRAEFLNLTADGFNLPFATSTTAPYGISWDTLRSPNGINRISVRVFDTYWNSATATLNVNVQNTGDTIPPTATVTSPANGSTVPAGSIEFRINASDNIGIYQVTYYVDGTSVGSENLPPFMVRTSTSAGSHTVNAKVRDFQGNVTTTASNSFTASNSVTPTPTPNAPTPTRTPTPQPTNTPAPTNTPMPTNTPIPNTTKFSTTTFLHGIGKGGDSVNPTGTGNTSPLHPSRTLTVELHENGTDNLLFSLSGTVNFNSTNGNFTGIIDGGTTIPSGNYIVKLKSPIFLVNAYPGTLTVTSGQTLTLQPLSLVTGDANSDNQLNILDYNLILDCYSELAPPRNCNPTKLLQTDLTDDGAVNQFDYNLFLRELSVQSGR